MKEEGKLSSSVSGNLLSWQMCVRIVQVFARVSGSDTPEVSLGSLQLQLLSLFTFAAPQEQGEAGSYGWNSRMIFTLIPRCRAWTRSP